MNTLSHSAYLALIEMRKGLYLLRQNDAEGLAIGANLITIKRAIKAGTIDELLENEFIRQHLKLKNLYLLTDAGRAYRQDELPEIFKL